MAIQLIVEKSVTCNRIFLRKCARWSNRAPDDPGLDRICRAAAGQDFPVNILCSGNLDAGTALIDRHPETRFVVDHLGLVQPSADR